MRARKCANAALTLHARQAARGWPEPDSLDEGATTFDLGSHLT